MFATKRPSPRQSPAGPSAAGGRSGLATRAGPRTGRAACSALGPPARAPRRRAWPPPPPLRAARRRRPCRRRPTPTYAAARAQGSPGDLRPRCRQRPPPQRCWGRPPPAAPRPRPRKPPPLPPAQQRGRSSSPGPRSCPTESASDPSRGVQSRSRWPASGPARGPAHCCAPPRVPPPPCGSAGAPSAGRGAGPPASSSNSCPWCRAGRRDVRRAREARRRHWQVKVNIARPTSVPGLAPARVFSSWRYAGNRRAGELWRWRVVRQDAVRAQGSEL